MTLKTYEIQEAQSMLDWVNRGKDEEQRLERYLGFRAWLRSRPQLLRRVEKEMRA